MRTNKNRPAKLHQGSNVKRFREMMGVRQEALADMLGREWNQKRISLLEAKEIIEPHLLRDVAEALKIPEEVLTNFSEEVAINFFNNFTDAVFTNSNMMLGHINEMRDANFNPLEKLMEAVDEIKTLNNDNKTLHAENRALYMENKELYERIATVEREKNEILLSDAR